MIRIFAISITTITLTACANKPPSVAYDAVVPPVPTPISATDTFTDTRPDALLRPPAVTPARGGTATAATPYAQIASANSAARIEPKRQGYFNAVQVYHYSPGALYRVYASPGRVTEIALDYGEALVGEGPIAAGDTARWIIGDTVSGDGSTSRVHIMVKPTRPDLETNLVLNTDRRTYHLELVSSEETYMPSISWYYPENRTGRPRTAAPPTPTLPPAAHRRHRYGLTGDSPPWRPRQVYDDGLKVYIEFAPGVVQGEMPPLFVIGADGKPELVNSRVVRNVLIVDRLFGAAELRLGSGRSQEVVRIVRTGSGTRVASADDE